MTTRQKLANDLIIRGIEVGEKNRRLPSKRSLGIAAKEMVGIIEEFQTLSDNQIESAIAEARREIKKSLQRRGIIR